MNNKCGCGCGKEVLKEGRRFLRGHNSRVDKVKKVKLAKVGKQNWKGGYTNHYGYRLVHKKNLREQDLKILLPMVVYAGRYIPEHRMIVALREGRILRSDEYVRHLDGNKLNNSPDNLLLGTAKDNFNDHDSSRKEVMRLKALLRKYGIDEHETL